MIWDYFSRFKFITHEFDRANICGHHVQYCNIKYSIFFLACPLWVHLIQFLNPIPSCHKFTPANRPFVNSKRYSIVTAVAFALEFSLILNDPRIAPSSGCIFQGASASDSWFWLRILKSAPSDGRYYLPKRWPVPDFETATGGVRGMYYAHNPVKDSNFQCKVTLQIDFSFGLFKLRLTRYIVQKRTF